MQNKTLFGILLCLLLLPGCRQQYKHMEFEMGGSASQTADGTVSDQAGTAGQIGAVPYTYFLLPAAERKAVFDTLMGTDSDVFFMQEPGREMFVVFDDQNDSISRIAQACRIGNEKSSVLVMLGMTDLLQQTPTVKVYTFENGRAANDMPYRAGKHTFLEQFQDPHIIMRPKDVQGISGATPIWKSVTEQVRLGYELLLKDKASNTWISDIRDNGKVWHRAAQQQDVIASAGQLDPPLMESDETSPEAFAFAEDDSLSTGSENDFLYEHWKTVATAEISLLACGLLIVAATQIKRAVYR